MSDIPPIADLRETVLDTEAPLAKRMRSIFFLRTLGTEEASAVLCEGALQRPGSVLRPHTPRLWEGVHCGRL